MILPITPETVLAVLAVAASIAGAFVVWSWLQDRAWYASRGLTKADGAEED